MGNEIPNETPIVLVPELQPVKRHSRLNKWHVITVVLVSVIAVQGILYVSLNSSYETLNADHKSLTAEYQNLTSDYQTAESEKSDWMSKYDSLRTTYNSLNYDYYSLQSNYDSYVDGYNDLRNRINLRTIQYSYTNVESFITPTDATVEDRVIQITGGWSNPSDWNEYWSDVKTMYDWVVNNIEYRSDGLYPSLPTTPLGYLEYRQEMWQFPSETLDLLQGDCEDMAILLTSLILSYSGSEYGGTECILLQSSDSGHVGVQMYVDGDLLTILDPAGNYYTQDLYGNISHKDISTEINNWLNYWKPEMGYDLYVDRVFSDTVDRSFSSTSEYTSWMYSR